MIGKTGVYLDSEIVQYQHQLAKTKGGPLKPPTQEAIDKEAGSALEQTKAYKERQRRAAKDAKDRDAKKEYKYLTIMEDLRKLASIANFGDLGGDNGKQAIKDDLKKRYKPNKDKPFYGTLVPIPTRPPHDAVPLPQYRLCRRDRHFNGSGLVMTDSKDVRDEGYDNSGVAGNGECNPFYMSPEKRVFYDRYHGGSRRGEWWVGPETDEQIAEDNAVREREGDD